MVFKLDKLERVFLLDAFFYFDEKKKKKKPNVYARVCMYRNRFEWKTKTDKRYLSTTNDDDDDDGKKPLNANKVLDIHRKLVRFHAKKMNGFLLFFISLYLIHSLFLFLLSTNPTWTTYWQKPCICVYMHYVIHVLASFASKLYNLTCTRCIRLSIQSFNVYHSYMYGCQCVHIYIYISKNVRFVIIWLNVKRLCIAITSLK